VECTRLPPGAAQRDAVTICTIRGVDAIRFRDTWRASGGKRRLCCLRSHSSREKCSPTTSPQRVAALLLRVLCCNRNDCANWMALSSATERQSEGTTKRRETDVMSASARVLLHSLLRYAATCASCCVVRVFRRCVLHRQSTWSVASLLQAAPGPSSSISAVTSIASFCTGAGFDTCC